MNKSISAIFCLTLLSVCALAQTPKTNASSMFGSPSAGSGGSVTSVDLSLPAIFTVTGGPVTATGTLTGTLATQTANTIFAGPTTGAAATPAFRALVDADFTGTSATLGGNTFSGTGNIIRQGSPTLTTPTLNTPTIAVFSGAQHDHSNANGGGQLGISAHTSGSLSGNGSKLATMTGSATSGKCLEWDASGNVVTAASNAACGSGGGGGSPGGSSGNVQYNNAGALGGVSILNFTAGRLDITGRVDITSSSDATRAFAVSAASTNNFGVAEFQVSGSTFAMFTPRRTLNMSLIGTPGTLVNGDIWQDGDTNSLAFYSGSLKHTMAGTAATVATTRTLTNSTSETSLLPTAIGTYTLPASYFIAGKTIYFEAEGYWSTDSSPGTFQVKAKLGSTTIVSTAANTPTGSISNRRVKISGSIETRTTGASGTVIGQGEFLGWTAATTNAPWEMVSTSTTTIDTTVSQAFSISGTWGTGSTNNSISITNVRFWVQN